MQTRPIACLIYDFDKTLSPRDMQEYGFLPGLMIEPADFWGECRRFANEHAVDPVLAYMYMMQHKARGKMRVTRQTLGALGGNVEFFEGVESWFGRINEYGESEGLAVEHYIISSGLQEIIEGSRIARHFKAVFAASFYYDENGDAAWPATAVNYTNKTQYLYRINKGILDITNHEDLNDFTPKSRRRVPYQNMIYIGDGMTDVPSMKQTRSRGGVAIAVHPRGDTALGDDMLLQGRVDFSLEANYAPGGELERTVFLQLRRIARDSEFRGVHGEQMDEAYQRRGGANAWKEEVD